HSTVKRHEADEPARLLKNPEPILRRLRRVAARDRRKVGKAQLEGDSPPRVARGSKLPSHPLRLTVEGRAKSLEIEMVDAEGLLCAHGLRRGRGPHRGGFDPAGQLARAAATPPQPPPGSRRGGRRPPGHAVSGPP